MVGDPPETLAGSTLDLGLEVSPGVVTRESTSQVKRGPNNIYIGIMEKKLETTIMGYIGVI